MKNKLKKKIGTKDLIVLDYSDAKVHYYRVADDLEVDEEFIAKLNFRLDEVSWMCGDLEEVHHKGTFIREEETR